MEELVLEKHNCDQIGRMEKYLHQQHMLITKKKSKTYLSEMLVTHLPWTRYNCVRLGVWNARYQLDHTYQYEDEGSEANYMPNKKMDCTQNDLNVGRQPYY